MIVQSAALQETNVYTVNNSLDRQTVNAYK